MKVSIITVGKLKEDYLKKGIQELSSQIKKKWELVIHEVPDEKAPENLSEALMVQVKRKEGERISSLITEDMFVITLEIEGAELTTEKLSKKFKQIQDMGKNHVCFIIGGSLGLSMEVSSRSDYKLSFSKMTFPHQLMRLMLLDQIYSISQ